MSLRRILFVAIGLLVAINAYVLLRVLFLQAAQAPIFELSEEELAEIAAAQVQVSDHVSVANLVQLSEEETEEGLLFKGELTVANDQVIGAEAAVVTLQLVQGGLGEIAQLVTDANGVAEFEFLIKPGAWRIEVLDITGALYTYAPESNVLKFLSGYYRPTK